uniref:Uncharacterized protein n=1 Tax=Amphilophus citrinellus TaxID=61819 RepID=A0A3Q0RSZ0_AMPCI
MDSLMSLSAPLKQFTSCIVSRRRSLPCNTQKVPDSWLRAYQAELKRERKRQQAILAKKNAERTVRRTHFRSHHCLPRVSEQLDLNATEFINDSFFGAFQGLSLDGLMGGTNGSPAVTGPAAGAGGDQCTVM